MLLNPHNRDKTMQLLEIIFYHRMKEKFANYEYRAILELFQKWPVAYLWNNKTIDFGHIYQIFTIKHKILI